jgi:hypothetical protein
MQVVKVLAGHVTQKFIDGGVSIGGRIFFCHVKVSKKQELCFSKAMKPNGPAIKRAERIETALWAVLAKEPACRVGVLSKELIKVSWYFSLKIVPVQGRYGTCFCRHGTEFIA